MHAKQFEKEYMGTKKYIERYKEHNIYSYTICAEGIEVAISNLGAAIESIRVTSPDGGKKDVCLAFDRPSKRVASGTYSGATVGRVANRIAGARFELNNKIYRLSANDGANTLHGGKEGFDSQVFRCVRHEKNYLKLSLVSPDGDQGFPGTMHFFASFLAEKKSLTIKFSAISDQDTLFAPTIHPYFCFGDTLRTELKISADHFTPIDEQGIPTGETVSVFETPFDFTSFKEIGAEIDSPHAQILAAHGYDHNFVLNGSPAAQIRYGSEMMSVETDFPGLQFYSGNFFEKNELCPFTKRQGFALEPQFFPNAANQRNFASPFLKAGERKSYFIKFAFNYLS